MSKVLFERVHPDVPMPARATTGSAGYDAVAWFRGRPVKIVRFRPTADAPQGTEVLVEEVAGDTLVLEPGDRAMIPTGLKLQPEALRHILVFTRSGQSFKEGLALANGVGLGDADFPLEYHALVVNLSRVPRIIRHGERVTQFVCAAHESMDLVEGVVQPVSDRTGGFGHTGR